MYVFTGKKMKKNLSAVFIILSFMFLCETVYAGPHHASGKIISLMASSNPAIRLSGNISPDNCDGGTYGWLYFKGSPEEKQRIYASALALSLSGIAVTVYTNNDGTQCKINNIQATIP